MESVFTASCDRIEGGVAILISDDDEREYTLRGQLALCLVEGGIYSCAECDGRITRVKHLTELERQRRAESLSILKRLSDKNKRL